MKKRNKKRGETMKKLFLIFLMALMLAACATAPAFVNANGQKVKACTTDFECERINNFQEVLKCGNI